MADNGGPITSDLQLKTQLAAKNDTEGIKVAARKCTLRSDPQFLAISDNNHISLL